MLNSIPCSTKYNEAAVNNRTLRHTSTHVYRVSRSLYCFRASVILNILCNCKLPINENNNKYTVSHTIYTCSLLQKQMCTTTTRESQLVFTCFYVVYVVHLLPAPSSLTTRPGGRADLNFCAFSFSFTTKVYKYLLHRTLNLVALFFLERIIFTLFASLRPAVTRNVLMSLISEGILAKC